MNNFFFIIFLILKLLIIIVPILISVAYFTLAERKILGAIQRRRGPNVIGVYGMLQPLSDGLKLLTKEAVMPSSSNTLIFIISPILTFFLSLLSWGIVPFSLTSNFSEINISILCIFAISSLGIYGVIMSGWSSNSQYSFIGALRSTAQMISYEITLSFIMLIISMISGSFNFVEIIQAQKYCWFGFLYIPLFLVFFVAGLAETNRHPFDLPEAEAELVAGYFVEYSAMGFALFFLGESANILFMCAFSSTLFLGGWHPLFDIWLFNLIPGSIWFSLKIVFVLFLFVWVRVAFPRYRYDQLMRLGWKIFLPLSLAFLIVIASLLIHFNMLPY